MLFLSSEIGYAVRGPHESTGPMLFCGSCRKPGSASRKIRSALSRTRRAAIKDTPDVTTD
jgi:hypothetical protein